MPPHLHPRSRLTSSLFATTLAFSFLVVGVPHLLPCPAPRVVFADGEMSMNPDGTQKRRRRRRSADVNPDGSIRENSILNQSPIEQKKMVYTEEEDEAEGILDQLREKEEREMMSRRECPIPKPRGIVGEILGFKNDSSRDGKGSIRPP